MQFLFFLSKTVKSYAHKPDHLKNTIDSLESEEEWNVIQIKSKQLQKAAFLLTT